MVATFTSTQTLVVNPAFLQEIKDSNPDLWHTVHQMRQVCECDDEPAPVSRQLARLLDELRDQLALQFSLEESYGYMAVPEQSSRALSELATQTQSQHRMLYVALTELAEAAEELQYRGVEPNQLRVLLQRTREFDQNLRDHEQTENELIEKSFDLS